MRDLKVSFTDAYETETSWVIADTLCNACFNIDKVTGKMEYLFSFEGEKPLQDGLYYRVYSYGRELFFAPGYAKRICAWNMDTEERTYYSIIEEGDTGQRYVDSYRIGDVIWLLPSGLGQPVVAFDMKRRKVEYWKDYAAVIPEEVADRKKPVFVRQYAKSGKKVYTVVRDRPYLVCMDLERKEVSVTQVGDYSFTDVGYDGNSFWFSLQNDGRIVRWTPDLLSTEVYEPETPDSGAGYSNIIEHQGRMLFVPDTGDQIMEADDSGKKLRAFCSLPAGLGKMQDQRARWRRFFSYRNLGDIVRLCPSRADYMVDIHVEKKQTCGKPYFLEADWYRNVFQKKFLSDYFANKMSTDEAESAETTMADLESYLVYVGQTKRKESTGGGNRYGKNIHQALDRD